MPTSGAFIAADVKAALSSVVTPTAVKDLLVAELIARGFKITETPDGKKWVEEFASAISAVIVKVVVDLAPTPLGTGIYLNLVKLSDTAGTPPSPTHV